MSTSRGLADLGDFSQTDVRQSDANVSFARPAVGMFSFPRSNKLLWIILYADRPFHIVFSQLRFSDASIWECVSVTGPSCSTSVLPAHASNDAIGATFPAVPFCQGVELGVAAVTPPREGEVVSRP